MSDCVYVGLGSNLGDRERALIGACRAMANLDAVRMTRRSSLYDTAPIGPAQPRYLNAVVELDCGLEPWPLFERLKLIERELGRVQGERWAPRLIDLDILLWGDRVVAEPGLQVPHLELSKRRFALEPLAELRPDARHPLLGVTVVELLMSLPQQDLRRVQSDAWSARP